MNDSTPQRTSPKEETLQFIRLFARLYQPSNEHKSATNDNNTDFSSFGIALC